MSTTYSYDVASSTPPQFVRRTANAVTDDTILTGLSTVSTNRDLTLAPHVLLCGALAFPPLPTLSAQAPNNLWGTGFAPAGALHPASVPVVQLPDIQADNNALPVPMLAGSTSASLGDVLDATGVHGQAASRLLGTHGVLVKEHILKAAIPYCGTNTCVVTFPKDQAPRSLVSILAPHLVAVPPAHVVLVMPNDKLEVDYVGAPVYIVGLTIGHKTVKALVNTTSNYYPVGRGQHEQLDVPINFYQTHHHTACWDTEKIGAHMDMTSAQTNHHSLCPRQERMWDNRDQIAFVTFETNPAGGPPTRKVKVTSTEPWITVTRLHAPCHYTCSHCSQYVVHNAYPTVFSHAQLEAARLAARANRGLPVAQALRMSYSGHEALARMNKTALASLFECVSEYTDYEAVENKKTVYYTAETGRTITAAEWRDRHEVLEYEKRRLARLQPNFHNAERWNCVINAYTEYRRYTTEFLSRERLRPPSRQCTLIMYWILPIVMMWHQVRLGANKLFRQNTEIQASDHTLIIGGTLVLLFAAPEVFSAVPWYEAPMAATWMIFVYVVKLLWSLFFAMLICHTAVWSRKKTYLHVVIPACEDAIKYVVGPLPWIAIEALHYHGRNERPQGILPGAVGAAWFAIGHLFMSMVVTVAGPTGQYRSFLFGLLTHYALNCGITLFRGPISMALAARFPWLGGWRIPYFMLNDWDEPDQQIGEPEREVLNRLKRTARVNPEWTAKVLGRLETEQQEALQLKMEVDDSDRRSFLSSNAEDAQRGYLANGPTDGWRDGCWLKLTNKKWNAMYYSTTELQPELAYYNFGLPSEMISPVWASTLANVKAALGKRHARPIKHKPVAEFVSFSKEVQESIVQIAKKAMEVMATRAPNDTFGVDDVHYEDFPTWSARFNKTKKECYARQNNKFYDGSTTLSKAHVFIKQEQSAGKEDAAKPRGIQATDWPIYVRYLMAKVQWALEATLDGKRLFKTRGMQWRAKYTCGMTSEQMADWISDVSRRSWQYVEADIKAFDGSFHDLPNQRESELLCALLPEFVDVYYAGVTGNQFCFYPHKNKMALHKQITDASKETKGEVTANTRYGNRVVREVIAKYRIDGQRRSGDPQTSFGNSVWNITIHLWAAYCVFRQFGVKNPLVEIAVLGDDSVTRFAFITDLIHKIHGVYEKGVTTAGHEPAVAKHHAEWDMTSFCSRYLFWRTPKTAEEERQVFLSGDPGVPTLLTGPARALQRGFTVRVKVPPVFSRNPAAYAAAVLQGKVDMWEQGGQDVPFVREALGRMFDTMPPKTRAYEANLLLVAKRLMVGTKDVARAADHLSTIRQYSRAEFAMHLLRQHHPAVHEAMQTELGEPSSIGGQHTAHTDPNNKFRAPARTVCSKLSQTQMTALALVAAQYTMPEPDRAQSQLAITRIVNEVRFSKHRDTYNARLRLPAMLPETPAVRVDVTRGKFIATLWSRMERWLYRYSIPSWSNATEANIQRRYYDIQEALTSVPTCYLTAKSQKKHG